MRNFENRVLSMFIVLAMVFSMLPLSIFAEGKDAGFVTGGSDEGGNVTEPVDESETTVVSTYDAFATALANGGKIKLGADIELPSMITIAKDNTVTIDLAGHKINTALNGAKNYYAFDNFGDLTIMDTVGGGEINARGIYNGRSGATNAKITLESGTLNAINYDGGYAISNYATFVMNGGTINANEDDPSDAATSGNYDATPLGNKEGAKITLNGGVINCTTNFTSAVENNGTVEIPAGSTVTVTAAHCVLSNQDGGTMTIGGGTFVLSGCAAQTDSLLYVPSGNVTINGGTFDASNTLSESGRIIGSYNSASVTVNAGTFVSNGWFDFADSSAERVTVKGGTFENVDSTVDSYVSLGSTVVKNGEVVTKGENGLEVEEAAPDMSGTVINVTAENAQDVLDGKYGNINGKTINFTESVEAILVLARATKYAGSGTVYYNYNASIPGPEAEATPWSEDISSVLNAHSRYFRTLENVTFTADAGVVLAGFSLYSGHNFKGGYDYVRDVATGDGVTCYEYSSLSGISFVGLTVSGSVVFNDYLEETSISDITFDGCTFTGTTNSTKAAISMNADTKYFTDVTVVRCVINNCYQGVYVQGVDGLVVANNTITNTTHNAIAIQSSTSNATKGEVVVKENYIEGAGDRAIRINNVADSTVVIKINNNIMVNSGDSDGQLIKAGSTAGATVDLENNFWAGKDLSVVIGSGVTAPTATGIVSGTFTVDPTPYCQAGVEVTLNPDGTWGAVVPKEVSVTSYAELVAALAAGKTAILANNITATGEINGTDAVIDLNGFTLTLTVGGNNFYGASFVKNGTVDITGCVAKGDCIIGIGDYSNSAVLDLEGVDLVGDGYSSAYAVLYVYNSSTLNITGGSIIVANDNASAGGVIKAHSAANGKVNVIGTESDPVELQFTNAKIGILDGTVVMDYVDLDIVGGANAINQSALTVKNSTLTVKDADGRALTLSQGDIVIENSVLDFSGCTEGEIRFKKALTLNVDENSTIVECDIWINAAGAKVNNSVVVGTEAVPDTVKVAGGVTTVKSAPNGTITYAFTDTATLWGEAKANAYESFVIKLYSGELLLATASLNNIGGIIDGDVNVTWNIPLNSAGNDEYWTVDWVNKITATTQPTGVELYCDGVKVSSNVSKLSAPDDIKTIYVAVADTNGEFVGYYTGLTEAFAVVENGYTVLLLNDLVVTTPAYGSNAINYNRAIDCVIDLNGHSVYSDVGNSVFRFNITGSGATSDVTVTLKNGKVISGKNTWCTVMAAGISADVKMVLNLVDMTIESNKPGDLAVKAWDNGVVNANGVTVNANNGSGGFYAIGGEIVLDNCTVNQKGLHTAPYLSVAVGVSNGGKATVNSGTYVTVPTAASEGNNQGISHGTWCAAIMSSGGTLVINGGSFANGYYNDGTGATPSYARGLFTVGADADYGDDVATSLVINGGTFESIGSFVDCETIWGSVTDPKNTYMPTMSIEITDGDFTAVAGKIIGGCDPISTPNPVEVSICGGVFASAVPAVYNAEGYLTAKNNDNGTYTVLKNVYFTYIGTSLRNEDAAEGKSNIRFGYQFAGDIDFTAFVWGWSFGFGNTNLTMAGKHYTVDNVTNLVLTNIREAQYDKVLNVQLYFEVEIDGVTYTVYDNIQSGSVNGCKA